MSLADKNRWQGKLESLTLEFKSSVDARSIAKAVCGMLNAEGGMVAIGVADDGAIIGVTDADIQAEELDRAIRKRISPMAPWSILATDAENTSVILIDVPFTTLILQIVENCEEDRPPRHAVRIP